VCPFVPVRNATMDDCVACAKTLGERLAKELDIPIFLYGYAGKIYKTRLVIIFINKIK
jgi:glutamate formiminotransferase/formiminotetrahydrofolate cyclodeaminase